MSTKHDKAYVVDEYGRTIAITFEMARRFREKDFPGGPINLFLAMHDHAEMKRLKAALLEMFPIEGNAA